MVTTPVATPAPEVQPSLSAMARIFGVLFSPKKTFEDIVRKPSWIAPVLLSTVLSMLAVITLNQRVNWHDYILQQIEKNPQAAQLSADQKEQRAEVGTKFTVPFVYGVGLVIPICFGLLVGLVMMGAYNLFAGAGAGFAASFAIVAHAGMVGIISTPLFLLVLFLKPYGTVDPDNPVVTNLGALLPEDSARWLVTLCKSLDIFSIWILILIAIGFAAVNPKKLKGAKSFTIAFSVWATYVLIRVGWAFIFS